MADESVDSESMRAWEALLLAHAALVDVLGEELDRECGLPLAWYDVLVQLEDAQGRARMHELARSILFSKSGLTRLIERMEREGYVRRDACKEDGRGTFAVLTPAGRRALARARPAHHRGIARHFGRTLTQAEARAIRSGLGKIVRTLRPDYAAMLGRLAREGAGRR